MRIHNQCLNPTYYSRRIKYLNFYFLFGILVDNVLNYKYHSAPIIKHQVSEATQMNESQKCKFLDEPVNIISCQHMDFLCYSLCFRHIPSATLIYNHTYHQKIALTLKLSFCSKSTICFSLLFYHISLFQNTKIN